MRLFCAVDTDPALHKCLGRASESLRLSGADARWTAPVQWHVTLKFLGEVADSALPGILAAVQRVAGTGGAVRLRLGGLGVFGGVKPRVVIARVADESGNLGRIAGGLDRELAPLGFHPDNHVFNPHLTLARIRSPRNTPALLEAIGKESPGVSGEWEVREIVLYESILRPEGADYRAVARAPLASPGIAHAGSRARQ